jgi:hypothetical protein
MKKFLPIFILSTIISGCISEQPPSDAVMIENFQKHKVQFAQLREYFCSQNERKIVMMDPEWSKPKATEEEKAYLYKIFKQISAKGLYYDGSCSFRVTVWSVGLGGDGDYKYYIYNPRNTEHLKYIVVSDLDNVDRKSNTYDFYVRNIEGQWYLGFDHWP